MALPIRPKKPEGAVVLDGALPDGWEMLAGADVAAGVPVLVGGVPAAVVLLLGEVPGWGGLKAGELIRPCANP